MDTQAGDQPRQDRMAGSILSDRMNALFTKGKPGHSVRGTEVRRPVCCNLQMRYQDVH